MAVAFRSIATNAPSGAAANTVVTKPAGAVDDDILIAAIYVEDNVAMTPPAGWTQIANIDHAAVNYDLWIYWKRAASEGASWTWTHASAWELGAVAAYSGCTTSGDPQDATATTNQGTSTSGIAASITTVTDNSMIVVIFGSFEGLAAQTAGSLPAPLTNNERYDGAGEDLYWADGLKTPAGATGTMTLPNALSASNHWSAITIALKPPTASSIPPGLGPVVGMPQSTMPLAGWH